MPTPDADEFPFPSSASSLSASDRAHLVGLSDNDVRTWCVSRADEHRRSALALLSIYNSIAPIHRLPPEILSKIFEGYWTDRKSLCIGHVCRQWRSVLLGTTGFWVRAANGDKFSLDKHSIAYLSATLERSASRLVELSFLRFSENISYRLYNHAGRIATLTVSLADESDLFALSLSLSSGMHCLKTLTIAFDDDDDDPDHHSWAYDPRFESLSPPVLPRLTRLTTPSFLFPILAGPPLHHITLKAWHGYHSYDGRLGSLECFCESLALCSRNLRSLALVNASLRADLPTTFSRVVSLPALDHLQITDTTDSCVAILSRLSLQKCPQIHCTIVDRIFGSPLSTILSANPNLIHPCISATDRLEIHRTAGGLSMHCCAGDKRRLVLNLAGSVRRLDPADIIEVFRERARVRELRVMVSRFVRADIWGIDFHAFPHLLRLVVSGEMAPFVLLHLAATGADPATGDGTAQLVEVLSPGLETLVVDFRPVRSRSLRPALRNRDIATVEADLRERCAELERVLEPRAQRGAKLTRLEFGCTDKGGRTLAGTGSSDHKLCVLDPTAPDWVSWRPIVEPLERLVDGPVVFTGYRFFVADQ